MQVTSATSTDRTYATASDSTSGTTLVSKKTMLGQDDFMKLLAVQFQQQDPMKPMEDTAFIAQMAQFTSLDQTKSMLTQMTQLSASQDIATANSFIGREVTLNDDNGLPTTGVVSGVQMIDGKPQIVISGSTYPLSSVLAVQPAPATSTSSSTTP